MHLFSLVSCIIINSLLRLSKEEPVDIKFPENFAFGIGTSAYQIEGAWNEDGKGENNFDRFFHEKPDRAPNQSNGDIACDSYHKYPEDVKMLKYLGVHHYRFSLSWSRILPTGYVHKVNQAGVDYYKKLIKTLKKNGIEPYVTLYHWDLPQPLQEIGGWLNPVLIEYFGDYAKIVFTLFGDDVKNWMTFNEPAQLCFGAYEQGLFPPGLKSNGIGTYMCGHTILKAHALAYHIYDNKFRVFQNGRISIALHGMWFEPATNSIRDRKAAERNFQFQFGWFANPIYSINGNYPQVMIDRISERSQKENFTRSRLPAFTLEEIHFIKGTFDYMCLNTYTTRLVKWVRDYEIGFPSYDADVSVNMYTNTSWQNSAAPWIKVVPWGIRKLLNRLHSTYNHVEIFIAENGYADSGQTNDLERVYYLSEYLTKILQSIEDGVKVTGYTLYSLMDSFEWYYGYTHKYGLYSVNFESPNRTRNKKKSSDFYKNVIAHKCLVDRCKNQSYILF